MAEFIVRARAAPVEPEAFRAAIGGGQGVEYLAEIIRSALFVSQGHRSDASVHLVLEKSRDFSRIVSFGGENLGSLVDLHEDSMLQAIANALETSSGLGKDEQITDSRGVTVRTTSFEHLVKARAAEQEIYLLDSSGEDIRDVELNSSGIFVMTDHTPMPKKSFKSMARQGVKKVSLGPVILHASQCITLIHNEMDRQADHRG
ncbi:MAG: tRNA (pseudouridine(54)-N(1))-methyltransferase TrmY [Gammaproteobacteria bacterium]|nr:tRNA (pseudouridine(54)-N(1))-methyltransferase TrmY [Gammaproteobacteria bacterium]MBT4494840.1 tRNA (pseudouridine(54)-N(1))-methyltransferase TrmY [Gammaproteobacteria bacterium]MBT7369320.1 tRNA (pseudouridine(54)-N(1))-methyltransferase TrmY [Gammaproteobacteria bacterium]